MATSSVHLPRDLKERLDRLSLRRGVSRNRLIVEACERLVAASDGEWPEGFFEPLPDAERRELQVASRELEGAIEGRRHGRRRAPF